MTEQEIWNKAKDVIEFSVENWQHLLVMVGFFTVCILILKVYHQSTLPKYTKVASNGDCNTCKNKKCGVRKAVEENGLTITDCVNFK